LTGKTKSSGVAALHMHTLNINPLPFLLFLLQLGAVETVREEAKGGRLSVTVFLNRNLHGFPQVPLGKLPVESNTLQWRTRLNEELPFAF